MKKLIFDFEGGEGAGKGVQIHAFDSWLKEQGLQVKISREPGGTPRGEKIRELLLHKHDPELGPEEKADIRQQLTSLADTVEHSGIPSGKLVESILELADNDQFTLYLEMALFVISRLIHLEEVIKPYIFGETEDDVLVLDRFYPSTFAYQVYTRSKTTEDQELISFIRALYEWHVMYIAQFGIIPTIVILDIDPQIGLARIASRPGEVTTFDTQKLPFHEMVREGYKLFANDKTAGMGREAVCYPYLIDGSGTIAEVTASIQQIIGPSLNR